MRFQILLLLFFLSNSSYSDVDSVLKRADSLYFQTEWSSALTLLDSNQNQFNDEQSLGRYHLLKSQILWEMNRFEMSFQHGDSALSIFEAVNDEYWIGKVHYTMSMHHLVAGNYDQALLHAQKAFESYQAVPDTAFQIKSLCRRALVFHDFGSYDEGIATCNDADTLHSYFSLSNADLQAIIWGIKAINHDDKGESDKAVEIYREIMKLRDDLTSDREIIRTYNNMGNSLMKLGYLEEAEKYISLNLESNKKRGFTYGIATSTTNLGTIAWRRGDFKRSDSLLSLAERISYEIMDAEKILDVLQQKHLMYEAFNRPEESLVYLKRYHSLKDSLYSLDKQRQLQLLEKRFQTEQIRQKVELQNAKISENLAKLSLNRFLLISSFITIGLIITIALLNRNRIRRKQQVLLQKERIRTRDLELNASISSQEKERTRFARDLHDGLGQLISLLNLNLTSLNTDPDVETRKKLFSQSQEVIDSIQLEIRNICFDLMPRTLISSGLSAAIEEFAFRINKTGKISVETDLFGLEKRFHEQIEISLYRIIQEWVNNIIKYSDASQISIQVTADALEITLLIEDNGTGFDKQLLNESKGNGWRNIQTRCNLIGGDVEIETRESVRGTTFILNTPRIHKMPD